MIVVGAASSVHRVSPVTKRILELLDGAAIAAVIPLLLWIASVYDLLRNLRFHQRHGPRSSVVARWAMSRLAVVALMTESGWTVRLTIGRSKDGAVIVTSRWRSLR